MNKYFFLFVILCAVSVPARAKTVDAATRNFEQGVYERMNAPVSPDDIKKDIEIWFDWLHATHPDPAYTVKDIDKFYAAVTQIKDGVSAPLTPLEFWKRFSVLNSHLSDGHLVVGNPDPGYLKDYLAKGGTLFPFEVIFSESDLVITDRLGGGVSELHGYSVLKINKIPIETIVGELLLRMNGDGERHRKALLQKRFAYLLMLFYGETKQFEITVRKNKTVRNITVEASKAMPFIFRIDESFAENFRFELLDEQNALLTINTFGWNQKEAYFDFMKTAFATMKTKNIRHLIIDVRENSGGDDDMWRDGILKYIAKKTYRWGSKYRKKILAKYRDEGQVVGQVVDGQIETQIPVEPDNQYRFDGQVSVLIGPYTYSSAILFINTVQDYKFGKLVGEPTGGKSGQTGGTQLMTLPHTGLRAVSPRFYLERPNGGMTKESVQPDLVIDYDRTKPFDLIKILLEK